MENEKESGSVDEVDLRLSWPALGCGNVVARKSNGEVMAIIDVVLVDVASGTVIVTGYTLVRVDGLDDIPHLVTCRRGPGFCCDPVGLDIGRLAHIVDTKGAHRILLFCCDNPLYRNGGLDHNPVTWI